MNDNKCFIVDECELPSALSSSKINELLSKMKNGSQEAKDLIVIHNIRLVLYVVLKKYKNIDCSKEELVAVGNLGLVKAIDNYDLSKGVAFTTYAFRCIDNEILMFLRYLKKQKNVESIEDVVFCSKNGREFRVYDKISDDIDIIEEYENRELYKVIRELVTQLPEIEKEIVTMYFGFSDDKVYYQWEIAQKLQISRSYVSKIITKVLQKIKKELESRELIEVCKCRKRRIDKK